MSAFARLNLARQYLMASYVILLVGMVVIGTWVGQRIERGAIEGTGAVTALYVDSLGATTCRHLRRRPSYPAAKLCPFPT